jgi:hypothetical protein
MPVSFTGARFPEAMILMGVRCEPRINTVGSGAINVGLAGCSRASRASN